MSNPNQHSNFRVVGGILVADDQATGAMVEASMFLPPAAVEALVPDASTASLISICRKSIVEETLCDRAFLQQDRQAAMFVRQMMRNNRPGFKDPTARDTTVDPVTPSDLTHAFFDLCDTAFDPEQPRVQNRTTMLPFCGQQHHGFTCNATDPRAYIENCSVLTSEEKVAIYNQIDEAKKDCKTKTVELLKANGINVVSGVIQPGMNSEMTIRLFVESIGEVMTEDPVEFFPIQFSEMVEEYCNFHNAYYGGFTEEDMKTFESVWPVLESCKTNFEENQGRPCNYYYLTINFVTAHLAL